MKVLLKSSFQDLLSKDNLFIIHHQNMQSLATKIYKILNNLLGGTIDGLFTLLTEIYFLPSEQELVIPKVSTVSTEKNSLDILVPLFGIQFQVISGTPNHTINSL